MDFGDALFSRRITTDWVEMPETTSSAIAATRIETSHGRTLCGDVLCIPGGLFPPADLQFWLHEQAIVHYPMGVLDGRMVLGPLVIPGRTPCLNCIDRQYLAKDIFWRATRVQATARPAGNSPADNHMLAQLGTHMAIDHLIPWRDAGMSANRVPSFLQQRHIFDPRKFITFAENCVADPDCVLCRMTKLSPPAKLHSPAAASS